MKKIKNIPPPFPSHKVIIKSLCYDSPARALQYLVTHYDAVEIIVLKQRSRSITIKMKCVDSLYELIKLHFIKDMGRDYLWKG
jgi:hypothetical protein